MIKIVNHPGSRLKQARISAGYHTAKDFYDQFNIKSSTYSAHESGRNPLNIKTAKMYGELLRVSPGWLLTGGEENHPEELNKYVLHYGQVPRDVLLNKMLNEPTVNFLKTAGIQKGMSVADLGCGTGSMSCWLAEYVGKTGFVYAVDKGFEQLSITKKRASELNITNMEYIRTEFGKQLLNIQADFIYMRCFLHHQKKPIETIKNAINLLPKNGIIFCMEPILNTFWTYPSIPETEKALNLYITLGQNSGLDFNIGKKLYSYLLSTNLLHDFQIFTYHGLGKSKFEKSWVEMITTECAIKYIEEKLSTEKEMDKMIEKISQHIDAETTLASLPEFICVTARKR